MIKEEEEKDQKREKIEVPKNNVYHIYNKHPLLTHQIFEYFHLNLQYEMTNTFDLTPFSSFSSSDIKTTNSIENQREKISVILSDLFFFILDEESVIDDIIFSASYCGGQKFVDHNYSLFKDNFFHKNNSADQTENSNNNKKQPNIVFNDHYGELICFFKTKIDSLTKEQQSQQKKHQLVILFYKWAIYFYETIKEKILVILDGPIEYTTNFASQVISLVLSVIEVSEQIKIISDILSVDWL